MIQSSTSSSVGGSAQFQGSEVQHIQPVKELPVEIWTMILSKLEFVDFPSTSLVSHAWCDMTLKAAKSKSKEITRFTEFVISNLDPKIHSIEITQLSEIQRERELESAKSVGKLMRSIFNLRERCGIILKARNSNHSELAKRFISVDMPRNYFNLEDVIDRHRQIEGLINDTLLSTDAKEMGFQNECLICSKNGMYEGVLRVLDAMDYSNEITKSYFRTFYQFVVGQRDLEMAIKVAALCSKKEQRYAPFVFLIDELVNGGDYDAAVQVCQSRPSKQERTSLLFSLISLFTEKNRLEKALEVMSLLDTKMDQIKSVGLVLNALIEKGDVEKAVELTLDESNHEIRGVYFVTISRVLCTKGKVDSALEIISRLDDPLLKSHCYKNLLESLKESRHEEAKEKISKILFDLQQGIIGS